MICARLISVLSRFRRAEDGAAVVELGFVVPLFLLLSFGFIDFARLGFTYVMTGKAMDRAVRMAVVTTPPCPDVPERNVRGTANPDGIRFGTSCSAQAGICAQVPITECFLDNAHPTSDAIWAEIAPLMPSNANAGHVLLSYEFTSDLGFLGGPYTPIVTAQIRELDFQFITPLGALAALAGAVNSQSIGNGFLFPSMSASLPAEALFDGDQI